MTNIIYLIFLSLLSLAFTSDFNWSIEDINQQIKHLPIDNPNYFIFDPNNYTNVNYNNNDYNNLLSSFYQTHHVPLYILFFPNLKYSQNIPNIETFTSLAIKSITQLLNTPDEFSISVLFAIKERKVRIRTGRSIQTNLTESQRSDIIDLLKPYLRKENYNKVVTTLIPELSSRFNHEESIFNTTLIIMVSLSVFVIIWAFYSSSNDKKKRREKIKDILDKIKTNKNVNIEECVICLEKLDKVKSQSNANKETTAIQVLECGHKFHKECIVDWINKNDFCPLCRDKVDKKNELNNNNDDDMNEPSSSGVYRTRRYIDDNVLISMLTNYQLHRMSSQRSNNRNVSGTDYSYDGSGGTTGSW